MSNQPKTIAFADLPALGAPLEGGIFAGVITGKDGVHSAVICLPENGTDLTWKKALAWAKKQDGDLPTRPEAALLFANVKDTLPSGWHWTCEEYGTYSAWYCYFDYGSQSTYHKSYEGSAVCVSRLSITA